MRWAELAVGRTSFPHLTDECIQSRECLGRPTDCKGRANVPHAEVPNVRALLTEEHPVRTANSPIDGYMYLRSFQENRGITILSLRPPNNKVSVHGFGADRKPSIVGCLGGPWGSENISERQGAEDPTFWIGSPGPQGLTDSQSEDPRSAPKACIANPSGKLPGRWPVR